MYEIRRPSKFDRATLFGRVLHWIAGIFLDDGKATLTLRIIRSSALCSAYYWLTKDLLGPVEPLFLAVAIGASFSRIIIDLVAEMSWLFRRSMMESMGGTYYQFQNFRLQVVEDDDHCRWIATEKIREIVGQLASDHTLAQLFPTGHQRLGDEQKGYLRDDAVMAHLASANTPQAIKFKNWIERNVAFPARKIRQRQGIVIRAATAERDD